jgi:hypothetical protein
MSCDRENKIKFNQLIRLARHFERCHRFEEAATFYKEADALFQQDKLTKKISKCESLQNELKTKKETTLLQLSNESKFFKNQING